jgi:hypothetical protein
MTKDNLPDEVKNAWNHWMSCNLWRSSLTRQEAGKLGAAKRDLNKVLKKHSLTFDEVGQALV